MPSLRRTPLTLGYLCLLALSTVLLHLLDPATRDALLAASSTDVAHLASDPLGVMVASALFLPDLHWLVHALELAAVLVPLERRYGAAQVLLVFACGHVLATLATELPVAYAVGHHLLPVAAAHRLDVGVSYGFYAALGSCLLLVRPRVRAALLVAAGAVVLVPLALDLDLTTTGHLLALACGLACAPLLRQRGNGAAAPRRPVELVQPRWATA
ncbi:MAG: hypothetical protein M3Z02_12650 [Actinomycetota bacterium]|nr:hypothetical protein [Actinomycetota bacterium]